MGTGKTNSIGSFLRMFVVVFILLPSILMVAVAFYEPFYSHLRFLVSIYLFALCFMLPLILLNYKGVLVPISVSLVETENKYRNLVENSLVGVYIIRDGIFSYVNPHFAEIFGYTQQEIIGIKRVEDLVLSSDLHYVFQNLQLRLSGEVENTTYEHRGVKKDGSIIYIAVYGRFCILEGQRNINGTIIDITEQKDMEERLRYFSFHDQLMGLYNRNYLEEAIAHISEENYTSLGVFAFDVDGLKVTNDTWGTSKAIYCCNRQQRYLRDV